MVGFIFSLGLGVSGMTKTQVVRGFLDVFGKWDMSLIGVMGGAIFIHSILFYFIKKSASPLLAPEFYIPTNKKLDRRLFLGASLFGLGWGWTGICPGPGLVALTSGDLNIAIFIFSMLIGMLIFKLAEKSLSNF